MTTAFRKLLLASVAMISVTASPVFQPADYAFSIAAYARGGSDDSGGDDHGGRSGNDDSGDDHGGRGGTDDAGGDDHGGRGGDDSADDDGGRAGDDGSGGDDHGGRSGHDNSDDDDHGRGRGRDDDAGDDHGRDRNKREHADRLEDDNDQRERAARPEVTLSVSRESLAGLLNGSLVAVDQLGRRLEVEVETEHGVRVVKAEVHRSDVVRNPGPITSVRVVAP